MGTEDGTIITIPQIYTDTDGATKFADLTIGGRQGRSPVSTAQAVHSGAWRADSLQWRRVLTEDLTGTLHNAPARQLAIQLVGAAEYETSSGEVRRVEQGGVILLDDLDGPGHTARNVGNVPRVSLFIRLGSDVTIA